MLVSAAALLAAAALAQTAPAPAAGSVAGTVRIERPPPKAGVAKTVKIVKDASVCGKEAASEALVVGPDRELANVVVVLVGAKSPQPPAPTANASVDQVGCRYVPHVQAVTVGSAMALLNNDAVFHNVHGTMDAGAGGPMSVFNLAMPMKGQKLPAKLKRPGTIKLRCDAGHTWMNAYIHVLEHPFFAVTDRAGKFSIAGVPPGRYSLKYWHEPPEDKRPAFEKTISIEVATGRTTRADAVLPLPL